MAQGSSNPIYRTGILDPNNSSTTPLAANGVFTGTAFEVTGFASINVNVYSNVDSATGGVKVEFSPDGTNWDHSHSTSYTAGTGKGYIFNAEYRYARVVYTNGATLQTNFRLQTIFKTVKVPSSLFTLDQTVNGNMFAEVGKNVIIGKSSGGGGTYVDVKVSPAGALVTQSEGPGALGTAIGGAGAPILSGVSVTTSAPTYSDGTVNALSVTTTGNLRTQAEQSGTWNINNISGTVSLPTGAATEATQLFIDSTLTTISNDVGSSLTALQLLDNAVGTHDAVALTTGFQILGYASSTAPTAVVNGDYARLWTTTAGALNIADAGGSITVDGTVAIGSTVTPGTGATNLGKAVDGAAGTTDTGVLILAVRDDALTTLTPVDNDYTQLRVTSLGRLWTSTALDTALPSGSNNIGSVNVSVLPALATGSNTIGAVTQSGTWTVQPGDTPNTVPWLVSLQNGAVKADISDLTNSNALNVAIVDSSGNQITSFGASEQHNTTADTAMGLVGGYAADTAFSPVTQGNASRFWTNLYGSLTTVAYPENKEIFAPSNATTSAYQNNLIVKASSGTLYTITGYNSSTSGQFIQIHNASSLPADTAIPVITFYVSSKSNFSFNLGTYGRFFSVGIVICNSSTGPTKTIGAGDCWFDVQYK
jgi:hypothetical protein